MAQYIDKDALVAEIGRRKEINKYRDTPDGLFEDEVILSFINTLEVKDPYEQCVQYDSIKAGIQAHAETYSFNIESNLFNQLTKEQQKLWRKEIEQAYVNGGEVGVELARDTRYKENLEVKEVDLEKELSAWWNNHYADVDKGYTFEKYSGHYIEKPTFISLITHFFELGLKVAQKGE